MKTWRGKGQSKPKTISPEERDRQFRRTAPACIFGPDWRIDDETHTYLPPVFDRFPEIMGGHSAMDELRQWHVYRGRQPTMQWMPPPEPIDFTKPPSKADIHGTTPIITFRFERIAFGKNPHYEFVTLFNTAGDQQRFCDHMDMLVRAKSKRDRLW